MCPDSDIFLAAPPGCIYKTMNGLSLAYAGDAVYELFIRRMILSENDAPVKALHSLVIAYVNADYQAEAADYLFPLLTAEEQSYYKRGRNASPAHTPKNKSEAQYHKATGFEALIAYLYLKEDNDRLHKVVAEAVRIIDEA